MSLLIISEEKIKQALAQIPPSICEEVEGPNSAVLPKPKAQEGQFVISGTIDLPPNNEESRNRLRAAFSRIDMSGTAPKTENELLAEIDEIRRRNL